MAAAAKQPTPAKLQEQPVTAKVRPGYELHYGYEVPKGSPMLPVELQAYRENRTEAQGGLGKLRHFKNAWRIAWPEFEWNDWAEIMVYAWCKYDLISVIGHAAAGKTYVHAHIALLDYVANPVETMTSLTTVTFEGLKLRMWGDLMRAYETCSFHQIKAFRYFSNSNRMAFFADLPGHAHEKYMMEGMATSRTKDSEGRIRGKHAPRRRVILDEASDMPEAIYGTFTNIRTDPDAKIVLLSNPNERVSLFGDFCEPTAGWGSVGPADLFWETKKGGCCVHLDGLQNPNFKVGMKDGKKKFHYMLGPPEVEEIRKMEGENSVKWWSQVRGFFPPDGMVSKVWPSVVIDRSKPSIVFDYQPEAVATLDPAFEHDDCVLHLGQKGMLRDSRVAINCTKTIKIVPKEGVGIEPKEYQIAHEVMRICKEHGVKPENYIQDRTGNGRGVLAVLQKEWSPDVQGINYGGEATDRPLRYGERDKAKEVLKYFVSELWFRARYLAEDGLLGGLGNLDERTLTDLSVRQYQSKQHTQGSLMIVESKDEMKKRLGRSPDYGDALVQFGELLARQLHSTVTADSKKQLSTAWNKNRERAKLAAERYKESSGSFF
jgi:hypothetical protein